MHATQPDRQQEPTEQWRPIPGYEGYYEVSDHGRVRSVERVVVRSDGRSCRYPGVVLQPFLRDDCHRTVTLARDGRRQTRWVYQLVMLAFVGPPPPGMEVCHWDGNGSNDVLSNLRYDTRSANIRDQVRHGTHNSGCGTNRCKRGHLLVAPNLVPSELRRGVRSCLACNRARGNVNDARWWGRPYDFDRWADEHYERIMQQAGASGPQEEPASRALIP
jgi:hypothetical protein